MKKIYAIITAILLTTNICAQSPEKMSYQAVIRNSSDDLITNTVVGMQISILQGSVDGTPVYVETQSPTTNANGLLSIGIGDNNAIIVSGNFATIDWANGPLFIKTETDPTGGTNYTITGISQLLSVPYALHAKTVENIDILGNEVAFINWDKKNDDDVILSGNQTISGSKTFSNEIKPKGIAMPYSFGEDTSYVGDEGNYIAFGHSFVSEDFIGYKNNTFFFKDSPEGGDVSDPDIVVGGNVGIGIDNPQEKLEVDGLIFSKSDGFKFPDGTIQTSASVEDNDSDPTNEIQTLAEIIEINSSVENMRITDLGNPINAKDVANKEYVDLLLARIEILENKLVCIKPNTETLSASNITDSSAKLNAHVNAMGYSTSILFEYGETNDLGIPVLAKPYIVDTTSLTNVSASLSNLKPNTKYYYRIIAENCGGFSMGYVGTFNTN